MKHLFILFVSGCLLTGQLFAQAPAIFNYQGVARNPVGNVIQNQSISLRLTIHDGSATGPSVYSETRTVLTNPFGLFNVQVGSAGATGVTGTIPGVNWATGSKFLQVEIDPAGGSAFKNIGTAQLASVPYALTAGGAAPLGAAGGDLSGTYPDPAIRALQGRPVAATVPVDGQSLVWNATTSTWEPGVGAATALELPFAGIENSNATLFSITNTGSGAGIVSNTGSGFAVHGVTSAVTSAGIIGDNTGGGEAVVGRTISDIAGAVVGRNSGGGYGVRGFISGNNSNTAIGVFGQVGLNGSTGRAGRFENTNSANIEANIFEVVSNSRGNIPDNTLGNASSFFLNNTNGVGSAIRGEVNSIFGNFGTSGVFGISSGTGGRAGLFYSSNPDGNGASLISITDGNGNAFTANAGKDGNGVESSVDGTGNAVYGWVPTFSEGRAARFNNFNQSNTQDVMTVTNVGNGIGGNFFVNNTNAISPAVKGEVNSIFANFGTAGVYGLSSGTGGFGGLFYASNAAGNGPALLALTEGAGNGITANAGGGGDGVEATADGTGNAIYGWVPNFGTGRAGRFANFNAANANPVVHVSTTGTGSTMLLNHTGPSGNLAVMQSGGANVARIDKTGRGFFNNGTQNSGADIAEAFDVTGSLQEYETGDILIISTSQDREVEKSRLPYSNLVAGVYATKPGVLLTEEHIDADISAKVPMGVVGVIPTKVCLEGGVIKRGDMLVTSSTPGVAMKADPAKVGIGQVIGKALQEFDATTIGKINVLVNVK